MNGRFSYYSNTPFHYEQAYPEYTASECQPTSSHNQSFDIFDSPCSNAHSSVSAGSYNNNENLAEAIKYGIDYDSFPPTYEFNRTNFMRESIDPFASPVQMNQESIDPFASSFRRPVERKKRESFFEKWKTKRAEKMDEISRQMREDFIPYGEGNRLLKAAKKKQVRMDEYLFKAKRIDKGSRQFGLMTTQEPKRGSRKKRNSIEALEEKDLQKEIMIANYKELSKENNQNSSNEKTSSESISHCRESMNKVEDIDLDATLPMGTPTKNPKEKDILNSHLKKESPFKSPGTSVVFRQIQLERSRKPTFDIPSPVVLSDNDHCEEILVEKKEEIEEEKPNNRELLIKNLVDDKFVTERDCLTEIELKEQKMKLNDGDVIRGKHSRKHLMNGKDCSCCRDYYENLDMTPSEKKEYIDAVSKHRYVHNELPETPERYWNLTLANKSRRKMYEDDERMSKIKWNVEKTKKTGIINWNK